MELLDSSLVLFTSALSTLFVETETDFILSSVKQSFRDIKGIRMEINLLCFLYAFAGTHYQFFLHPISHDLPTSFVSIHLTCKIDFEKK